MKDYKLGEKIKSRRKQKGITQSALVGDVITRSMLSLIESGAALPSLETLEYLSQELDLPLAYLLSESDALFPFEKQDKISYIRAHFAKKNYTRCIEIIDTLSGTDDELSYIYAISAFELGKQSTLRGALSSAEEYFKSAYEKSNQTIYKTDEIELLIPLYMSVVNNIQSPLLEFDADGFEHRLTETADYEFFKYITLDFSYKFKNELFRTHMEAKAMLKKYNYLGAISLLLKLEEHKNTKSYNAYLLFGIYTDLENAYKQIGDFENAYRYSNKRIILMTSFKS